MSPPFCNYVFNGFVMLIKKAINFNVKFVVNSSVEVKCEKSILSKKSNVKLNTFLKLI